MNYVRHKSTKRKS